jgi:hypothetical protein
MYTIVIKEARPYAVRGMPFHGQEPIKLESISPELVAMGCPTEPTRALAWAACQKNLELVSRTKACGVARLTFEKKEN